MPPADTRMCAFFWSTYASAAKNVDTSWMLMPMVSQSTVMMGDGRKFRITSIGGPQLIHPHELPTARPKYVIDAVGTGFEGEESLR